MELNVFVAQFADQFFNTDISVFKPETKFRNLDEWSSLMALSVIAMVDEEYGIALQGNDMKAAVTIEDLFNIVKSKL